MSLAVSLRLTPWCEQPYVLREEPGEGTIRAWRGMGTLGWRPPFSTKVSAGWLCDTGAGLSAIRAAAAPVRGFSLLAVLVYVSDEHPAVYTGAGTLKASVVRLYGV